MEQLRQRTVIVPLADNAGVSLARERKRIEQDLLALAGGFSRYRLSGVWHDRASGKTYRDSSHAYVIVATAEIDATIEAQLPGWCELTRQEVLFTSVTEVAVSFVAAVVPSRQPVPAF